MEQQNFIIQMALDKRQFTEIKGELVHQWGQHALADSTIRKYIALAACGVTEVGKQSPPGRPADEGIDRTIIHALKVEPFASTRRISVCTNIPQSTVYRHLIVSLGMIYKKTKWVPHKMEKEDLRKRVDVASKLLDRLLKQKHHGWHNLVTGDESWFYSSYAHKGKWCMEEESNPKAVSP